MTVARDAVLEFATFTTTSPATLSFTPVGTPRGVTVAVTANNTGTGVSGRTATSVSYGGVPMVFLGQAQDVATETGKVELWFLGAGIPTGTQTVSIVHPGDGTVKWAIVQSVTAAADTEPAAIGVIHTGGTGITDPSRILDSGALSALRVGIMFSGADDISSLTPLAGMEALTTSNTHDYTSQVVVLAQQSTASTGAFTLGFTATADDCAYVAISIREVQTDGFPDAAAPTYSYFDAATTAHLVQMPFLVEAGDLLLMIFASSNAIHTTPTGWAILDDLTASYEQLIYWKVADGTEGATTVDVVSSGAIRGSALVHRIPAASWDGVTTPEVGTGTSGTGTAITAPAVTPSWGTADTLWIGVYSQIYDGEAHFPTAYPATYSDGSFTYAIGTQATWVTTVRLKLNAATSDPGDVTSSSGGLWQGQQIAIRPAAPAVPTAPTNLVATAISATRIDLVWTDNASDETSFRVERSPDGVGSWSTVGTPAADATTFSNTGLTCETGYFYRVFAVNGSGDSLPSNTDSATTLTCPPLSPDSNRMGGTGAIRRPPRTYLHRRN